MGNDIPSAGIKRSQLRLRHGKSSPRAPRRSGFPLQHRCPQPHCPRPGLEHPRNHVWACTATARRPSRSCKENQGAREENKQHIASARDTRGAIPARKAEDGSPQLGDDNNARPARAPALPGLSGGSHSSASNPPYPVHNKNQQADTFLSHFVLMWGFSLAWESVGDSHISKNFPFAFRTAACRIPLGNALPFAQRKQAHACATFAEHPSQQ